MGEVIQGPWTKAQQAYWRDRSVAHERWRELFGAEPAPDTFIELYSEIARRHHFLMRQAMEAKLKGENTCKDL